MRRHPCSASITQAVPAHLAEVKVRTQARVQKAMAAPPSEPSLSKVVGDAFAQYKSAIQAAVTETKIDDLDPTTLSAIGQSFCEVARLTHHATLLVPPAKTA